MCKSMVVIKNPKFKNNTFKLGIDPTFVKVPCGMCIECRTKKVNDLIVRAYFEWLACKEKGGFAYMTSLTFNPEHVPMYDSQMCFRKSDLANFFKRLKTNLKRRYNITGIKIIATSEYGKNTQRPHYHIIIFVYTDRITPFRLYCELKKAWCADNESVGFIDRFKPRSEIIEVNGKRLKINASVIDSVYGIRYVCKYLCKDYDILKVVDRYKDSGFYRYYQKVKDPNVDPMVDVAHAWNAYSYEVSQNDPDVKDYTIVNYPYVSHGLGISFLDRDYEELLGLLKSYVSIPAKTPTGKITLSVPHFYIRKMFYNYDKVSKRYIPNDDFDKYQKIKLERFTEHINTTSQFLHYYDDVFQKVQSIMKDNNITLKGVVNYMFFLRGRSLDAHSYFISPDPEDSDDMACLFERNMNVLIEDRLEFVPDPYYEVRYGTGGYYEYDWSNYIFDYYHEHPKYAPYEEIASIFDDISERLKKKKIEDAELEEKLDRAWQMLHQPSLVIEA